MILVLQRQLTRNIGWLPRGKEVGDTLELQDALLFLRFKRTANCRLHDTATKGHKEKKKVKNDKDYVLATTGLCYAVSVELEKDKSLPCGGEPPVPHR